MLKYGIILFVFLFISFVLAIPKNKTGEIPEEQFKMYSFEGELWHPHFSKARITDDQFVIVDNYKEHVHKPKLQSWLQLDSRQEETRDLLTRNFYDDELMPDTDLPGQNKTDKGPFN